MTVINFTATFDLFASANDGADGGIDADIIPLIGTVTFTPQLRDNKPLLAPDFSPREAGLRIRPFTGYIDTDGQLKASAGGPVGVRLWANDPVLNVENLYYSVKFNVSTQAGQKVRVDGGVFEAPSTDTTVNLVDVLTATASHISGVVRQSGYAEDIMDAGATGRALVRSANATAAWDALGTVPTGNLPSYVDDVLEFANVAAFPATGEAGKIYLALDTTPAQSYRWSGSAYLRIGGQTTSTDIVDANAFTRSLITSADAPTARGILGVETIAGAATGTAATDAATLMAALASPTVRVMSGTYAIPKTGVSVGAGKSLRLDPGASLKLADAELNSFTPNTYTQVVTLGSGARFVGAINGNRDNQDKTANNGNGYSYHNSAGTTGNGSALGRQFNAGIVATGTSGSPLKGLHIDATISGVAEFPVLLKYVEDSYIKLRVDDCGGAVLLENVKNCTIDIEYTRPDNKGWKVFASAITLNYCENLSGPGLAIRNQTGAQSGIYSGGFWNCGYTLLSCKNLKFGRVDAEFTGDDNHIAGLGASFIGCSNLDFPLRVVGYRTSLELCGVVESDFSPIEVDGIYRKGIGPGADNGSPTSNNLTGGVSLYSGAPRGGSGWASYVNGGCRNVSFRGGYIRRILGTGLTLNRAINCRWTGIRLEGNWKGLATFHDLQFVGSAPPPITTPDPAISGHSFVDCVFAWNERSGIVLYDIQDTQFVKCRAYGNSQSAIMTTTRSGLGAGADTAGVRLDTATPTSGSAGQSGYSGPYSGGELVANGGLGTKAKLWLDVDTDEVVGFGGAGQTTVYTYYNPADSTVLQVDHPERFAPGQTLKFVGAGTSGADLLARVNDVDISQDTITIDRTLTTQTATTLSGTITTSGTTVTGSGTSFTALGAAAWLKLGSEYRRIVVVSSDTSAKLESPFSTNASGAALVVYRAAVVLSPQQLYGFNIASDTTSVVLPAKAPVRNVNAAIQLAGGISATAVSYMMDTSTAQALKGKSIALADNTITGTLADFNSALTGANFATQADVDTLNTSISSLSGLSLPNTLADFPTGEANIPRLLANLSTSATGFGIMRLGYFTAQKTETITRVRTVSGTSASGATLIKLGVFSVAANGTLTLAAVTGNLSSTHYLAANTQYYADLTAPWTKTAGQRYATAVLVVGSGTAPTLAGFYSPIAAAELAEGPRLMGHVGTQTDFGSIGSTIPSGSISNSSAGIAYMVLLPTA